MIRLNKYPASPQSIEYNFKRLLEYVFIYIKSAMAIPSGRGAEPAIVIVIIDKSQ